MSARREPDFIPPPRGVFHEDGTPIEPVPTYSRVDDGGLIARIEHLQAEPACKPLLQFPITTYPKRPPGAPPSWAHVRPVGPVTPEQAVYELQVDIVKALFDCVVSHKDDLVATLVERGLVAPDVRHGGDGERYSWRRTQPAGQTPLGAAVRAGDPRMVRTLLVLGADVNAFGRLPPQGYKAEPVERTPLMLAAERGHLALVKYLLEDCGADDAIIAPDGALALRLAAANGHREIVQYLPLRRGGAWRRWQVAHADAMRRVKAAGKGIVGFFYMLFWSVPKFFIYTVPRHLWEERKEIGRWYKRQMAKLPKRLGQGLKKVGRGLKRAPRGFAKITKWLWRFTKNTPLAFKALGQWLWNGTKAIGAALGSAVLGLVSLLHTVFGALASFFQQVTLRDVWDGFVYVLHAIFVDTPTAVYAFIVRFGDVSWLVLRKLFGGLGEALWCLVYGLYWVFVRYIPLMLLKMAKALGDSLGKGVHEMLVWIDPKRVD